MLYRRLIPALISVVLLVFEPANSLAAPVLQQKQSGTTSQVNAPPSVIKPKPKVTVNTPQRLNPRGSQGVVAPGKPRALPRVITPVPDADAPSRVNTRRPDPAGTISTSGSLSYKYVCQARREWCYVNASKPIPADTICYCGDLEGVTIATK